jgi:hypothetical protein
LEKIMFKALLCKLNLGHDWHIETTEDGGRYRRCTRCGKYQAGGSGGRDGNWAAPLMG